MMIYFHSKVVKSPILPHVAHHRLSIVDIALKYLL
jgi:hypothetical protein